MPPKTQSASQGRGNGLLAELNTPTVPESPGVREAKRCHPVVQTALPSSWPLAIGPTIWSVCKAGPRMDVIETRLLKRNPAPVHHLQALYWLRLEELPAAHNARSRGLVAPLDHLYSALCPRQTEHCGRISLCRSQAQSARLHRDLPKQRPDASNCASRCSHHSVERRLIHWG